MQSNHRNSQSQTQWITWKTRRGKKSRRGREKFNYVNGDYNRVLWIQMNLIPFMLEGISYLYKSCEIDKDRKFYSVGTLKFLISTTVEPSTQAWIDIWESQSLFGGLCLVTDGTNYFREVTALFEWGFGLEIEIFITGFDSSINCPTRLKFELDEGTGLNVLEVAMCRAFVWG